MDCAGAGVVVPTVDAECFQALMASRAASLLGQCQALISLESPSGTTFTAVLTRPFLASMLSQATQLEELLDAYGALNNARWNSFRRGVAAAKLFTRVHYVLLHLQHTTPNYQLLPVEGSLEEATRSALHFTGRVIARVARQLAEEGARLALPVEESTVCREELPPGLLAQDCPLRHVLSAGETVAKLATAFLNLSASCEFLAHHTGAPATASDRPPPEPPGEAELRDLEHRFHNLQALYDTYVSNTDVEHADSALRSLRGHVSVIYHLLEIATDLAHYYERHARMVAVGPDPTSPPGNDAAPLVDVEDLRSVLQQYALLYSVRFLHAGREFCQQLLRRYAELGEAILPIPRYRGFHVRPSTLVAKIVNHYGGAVTMTLEDESYDASSPLELFRANERINAVKRRRLATEIAQLVEEAGRAPDEDFVRVIRRVILTLAERGRIVVYEQPVPAIQPPRQPVGPELTLLIDEITRLHSLGKIDIASNLTAVFRGDRRILADIQLLAENGYGEDLFGNNIALPKALAYLRG